MGDSPIPGELLARLHENFAEAYRVIGRTVPGAAVWESEGATAIATGVRRSEFNRLFVLRDPADAEVLLDHASQFFAAAGVPWCIIAPPEVARSLANASAIENGPRITGMVLAPLPAAIPASPPGLAIVPVTSSAAAREFVATMASGFGAPRRLFEIFGDPTLLGRPGFTHYLGSVDGKAVATASLVASHGIAGVFNVSTLVPFRRRGFGEAMTYRVLADGAAAGCIAGGLQATALGHPIYLRMGFRDAVDYRTWYPLESLLEEARDPEIST